MTAPHDLDRQLDAFLQEGPTELPDPSFDAVRDRVDQTHRRVVIGPWRVPDLNKIVPIGLGAAAVIGVILIGSQLLGPAPSGVGGPASPIPSASVGPSAEAGSDRAVVVAKSPVPVTVSVLSPGWVPLPGLDALAKNDDGKDAPDSVGAALLAWSWPAGTGFNVYGDPCRWTTTIPATPATTPDAIAAAFAAQGLTEPTAPVDVTIGGYAGKAVTLTVPMTYHLPGSTREERFADCAEDKFAFYGIEGEPGDTRNAQGAGQVDELWILDVNGSIVILDATYTPATPAELVDELRALAESATFE